MGRVDDGKDWRFCHGVHKVLCYVHYLVLAQMRERKDCVSAHANLC